MQLIGRAGALGVLDADRTLANAEQSVAAAQTQVSADQITAFMALGGGWQPLPAAAGGAPPVNIRIALRPYPTSAQLRSPDIRQMKSRR